ncbi:hypothetical protein [Flavobacterium sp. ASW18X]|uniref:hypothetical protein n=1 Tax=Flavobacterium sp. ASW18X TaxID=2572595 RepID=UPI0010AEAEF7|nr:hypothetical protein [Flavobacterium sp. ASW18X]TKD67327.1 hypothetical protein FBT53_00550 [Flavobacterium sp. ASW18X]
MIDFTKIWVTDPIIIDKMWRHPLLYTESHLDTLNYGTGELLKIEKKAYKGVKFILEPHCPKDMNEANKRLVIEFKPHYWHNANIHNANDFNVRQSIRTFNQFINLFGLIDTQYYKIVNLEFGVNFSVNGYDKNLVLYPSFHSRNEFRKSRDLKYSSIAHSFDKSGKPNKYLQIKFYSKGFQFPDYCNENTLRFEVKTKQSRKLKKLGIANLKDLTELKTYDNIYDELLKQAGKLLLIDLDIKPNKLKKREVNKLIECSNPFYWNKAINQKRVQAFNDKKKRYLNSLEKTGFNLTQTVIDAICNKANLLMV